jgi:hypothetical protein
MVQATAILKREEGWVIITALLMLVLLTIVGISATTLSNTELHVSTNGQLHKMAFFVAEGGWQVMTSWLDRQYPLPTEDLGSQWLTPFDGTTDKIVDHLSFGRDNFDGLNNDGDYETDEHDEVSEWVPFAATDSNRRYRVSAAFAGASIAPGWDPTLFLRYNYAVTSTGGVLGVIRTAESQIMVTAGKIQDR